MINTSPYPLQPELALATATAEQEIPEPLPKPDPIPFSVAQIQINKLLGQNEELKTKRSVNRKLRVLDYHEMGIESTATGDDAGKLSGADIIIPMHQIHKLMMRKFPDLYQFLTQPPRVAVFVPLDKINVLTEPVESWLTNLYRYAGWKRSLITCIDGALLHGRAAVEFQYDENTPGNFVYNYVAYADLVIQEGASNIEHCEYVGVRKYLSHQQIDELKELPSANLNELDRLFRKSNDRTKIEEVYRFYCKHKNENGEMIVYSFWYAASCSDFLVAPTPLYCGEVELKQSMPQLDLFGMPTVPPPPTLDYVIEQIYPIDIFSPFTTEEDTYDSSRGQAHWGRSGQKAMSALASSIITKSMQSAGVYASVDVTNVSAGEEPRAMKPVQRNQIYHLPIKFTSPEGPDASSVPIIQWLDSQQAEENGQSAYAVSNRKDSRRTAEELQQAQAQQDLNKSMLIDALAEWLLATINRAWRVAKSRALAAELTGYPVPPDVLPLLEHKYNIYPAGYTDLIERAQLISNLEKYFPVAVQAGIGPSYTKRLMQIVFPRENFANEIQTQQQTTQVLAAALAFIQDSTTQEELQAAGPEGQKQYQELINAIQTTIAGATQPMGGAPSNTTDASADNSGTQQSPQAAGDIQPVNNS